MKTFGLYLDTLLAMTFDWIAVIIIYGVFKQEIHPFFAVVGLWILALGITLHILAGAKYCKENNDKVGWVSDGKHWYIKRDGLSFIIQKYGPDYTAHVYSGLDHTPIKDGIFVTLDEAKKACEEFKNEG